MSFFEIQHNDKHSRARTGVIHTDHGDIQTPIFMPVGTQATVKSLDTQDLHTINAQIILGNTYHLHLRPGEELIDSVGGLHKFMNWDRPILTDSGGFQVFSLAQKKTGGKQRKSLPLTGGDRTSRSEWEEGVCEKPVGQKDTTTAYSQGKLVTIDEDGVTFRSHIDGSEHRFTPESAIEIQHKIGADIIMAFDECTPDNADEDYVRAAMERTHRWAKRCIEYHESPESGPAGMKALNHESKGYRQFLFGIIQGGNNEALRKESAHAICSMNFDGVAVGGESIGYNMEATKQILNWIEPILPQDKPRYTMGVGFSPLDLFDVVERGVDMFDCVAPTRMARNGTLYIKELPSPCRGGLGRGLGQDRKKSFRIAITNAQFKKDFSPIDPSCACFTCTHHTRAYLHHLFAANELLAYRLATIHNVHFFIDLMEQIRAAINAGQFLELRQRWV